MGVFKSVRGSKFTVGLMKDGVASKVKVFKSEDDAAAYAESLESTPKKASAKKEIN